MNWWALDPDQHTYDQPWDKDKFYGCVCAAGWAGYDCSHRECPVGDDPLTESLHNEIQLFYCSADWGWFTMRWGDLGA